MCITAASGTRSHGDQMHIVSELHQVGCGGAERGRGDQDHLYRHGFTAEDATHVWSAEATRI